MNVKVLADRILVGGGAIAVAIGAYLPWLKRNPDVSPAFEGLVPPKYDISPGFDGYGFAFLGVVGLVLLLRAASSRPWLQPVVTLLAGGGIVTGCAYYLSTSTDPTGMEPTFVLAFGWYLTAFGGILFLVAGTLRLLSLVWSPVPTALKA